MLDIVEGILIESWKILNAFSVYFLIGLCVSGILKGIMSDSFVVRHLGSNTFRAVIKAALLGIPLPLCSCGVIPVAIGLRRQGAGTGPTTAFLIATPETGVDSIAVTYALLDPLITIIRPVAAFLTAMTAGSIVTCMPEEKSLVTPPPAPDTCSCQNTTKQHRSCCTQHTVRGRIKTGLQFSFRDLLADVGPPLLFGVVLAGIISYVVPPRFLEQHLVPGVQQMLVMLIVGIPLYVCATASTPIVAALALKGLSPGAALVFLLAGPATNIATIMIVATLLGRRIALVYVGVIAVAALVFGMATDALYGILSRDLTGWITPHSHTTAAWIAPTAAVVLLGCIVRARFLSRT